MNNCLCICTGFALIEEETGVWYPADLFQKGEVFIVNASGAGCVGDISYSKQASFSAHGGHFERRGVFVFDKDELAMNSTLS